MSPSFERTRQSLFVPATYLTFGGLFLLLSPRLFLRLMLSNSDYGDVFPRFAGALILGLALLVIQTVRYRIVVLYPALIWVRAFFCACYVAFFLQTRDPFFLMMLGLVGSGVIGTAVAYQRDRRVVV